MKMFFKVLPGAFLGGSLVMFADLSVSHWQWWAIMCGTFILVGVSEAMGDIL